jgi:hypothetical protein
MTGGVARASVASKIVIPKTSSAASLYRPAGLTGDWVTKSGFLNLIVNFPACESAAAMCPVRPVGENPGPQT